VLTLTATQRDAIVAACVRHLPDEGCGVLIGSADGVVADVLVAMNVAASARVYEIDPRAMLAAQRRADQLGAEIIGAFHSHTHSDAYPSATDVRQAPDPTWHYVIASLRIVPTVLRSYRIVGESVSEEAVTLLG
jgi:proteasome lid subunit RPN8/RPN11